MASILVIDDDRAVLSTIKLLLERAAHAVEAVDHGQAGLGLLETRPFDLLIVDIFMPGMDGFETMRLVHRSWPEMPVIVISGQQFRSTSERGPDLSNTRKHAPRPSLAYRLPMPVRRAH